MTTQDRIRTARLALNMSQAQFARALGLRRKQSISEYECGKRTPQPYIWLAIDQLLLKERENR